eukprot:3421394-Pyramimonas_sp.AAC.1
MGGAPPAQNGRQKQQTFIPWGERGCEGPRRSAKQRVIKHYQLSVPPALAVRILGRAPPVDV